MLEEPLGECAGRSCARVLELLSCAFVPSPGQIVSDLGVQIAESTFGASREEPREAYIMFADPKPYLVRRKKKAPWEKVEERLKRG